MKKQICLLMAVWMTLSLAACSGTNPKTKTAQTASGSESAVLDSAVSEPEGAADGMDYMALVNKRNPLPGGWEILTWGY